MNSVRVDRQLSKKVGELAVSEHALRYVEQVKTTVASRHRQRRDYEYEPILDMVPGVPREVMVGEEPSALYFVVFVPSCSRRSYVGVSLSPLGTTSFVRLRVSPSATSVACPTSASTPRPRWR